MRRVLLIEIDGLAVGIEPDVSPHRRDLPRAGRAIRTHRTRRRPNARALAGTEEGVRAMGRIAPHLIVQDAVVPRTKLPDVMRRIAASPKNMGTRLQRLSRRRRKPAPEHRLQRQ
jgi:glycolate oxidase